MTIIRNEPPEPGEGRKIFERMKAIREAKYGPDKPGPTIEEVFKMTDPRREKPAPGAQPPFQKTATVTVGFHQFWVDTIDPEDVGDHANLTAIDDMVSFVDEGLAVATGVSMGPVEVTVAATTTRPEPDTGNWEQVVEASITTTTGYITVTGFDETDPFPNAATAGEAAYRVRVSARGRGTAYDTAVSEVTERYLIEIWAERPSPAEVLVAQQ